MASRSGPQGALATEARQRRGSSQSAIRRPLLYQGFDMTDLEATLGV